MNCTLIRGYSFSFTVKTRSRLTITTENPRSKVFAGDNLHIRQKTLLRTILKSIFLSTKFYCQQKIFRLNLSIQFKNPAVRLSTSKIILEKRLKVDQEPVCSLRAFLFRQKFDWTHCENR